MLNYLWRQLTFIFNWSLHNHLLLHHLWRRHHTWLLHHHRLRHHSRLLQHRLLVCLTRNYLHLLRNRIWNRIPKLIHLLWLLLHRHHDWLLLTHYLWILHVRQLLWDLIWILHLSSHLRMTLYQGLLHHLLSWLLHHHWLLSSHIDLSANHNILHRLLLPLRKNRRILNLSINFLHFQIDLLMLHRLDSWRSYRDLWLWLPSNIFL